MKHGKIIVILAIVVFAMVSCSYENTATVTIDTGIRKQAQLSLLDKVIAWFSLSNAVQADPVPEELEIDTIKIKVSAPDMQTITESIPLDTGRITLEIPAGSQRTFEVVGFNNDNMRMYGGITIINLSPGQNVDLSIEMGKLTSVSPSWDLYSSRVNIRYYKNDNPQPIFFKVYQNIGSASPTYILIDTVAVSSLSSQDYSEEITYFYSNSVINSDNRYQFYISAVNKYGEGEKIQIY